MSVQTRSTPHSFYPGMRIGQGPNRNVAPQRNQGRSSLLVPGMMNLGAGTNGSSGSVESKQEVNHLVVKVQSAS